MPDIDFDVLPERVGLAEQSKYFDAKIDALRRMVEARPEGVSVYDTFHWQRRFMAHYGKVLGGIEYAVDFKHIPLAMGKAMEMKIKRMLQHHVGVAIIG